MLHFELECVKIILEDNKLVCEYTGSKRVDYLYDGNGILYGLIYNGNKYFYLRDHLANILGIIDSSGNLVVSYDYSAYGKLKSITGSMASTLGQDNHMRYKGYYFDEETGFYYCKSRYYVPEWCRWLNADSPAYLKPYSATGNNLFAYCENNPVMGYDPNGTFDWNRDAKQVLGVCAIIGLTAFAIIVAAANSIPFSGLAIGTALGLATNVTSQVVGNLKDGEQAFNSLDYKQMILGAATGLAFATTGASGLIGAISIGAVSNAGMSAFKDNSWGNILGSAVVGGVAAGIGYGVGRLVSRFVFANDDMQYGEYYELTHLDRNAICSIIRAFGASLHTFLPTIVNPLSRAITQVLGNIFIGWF